jgi:hypothetical protein
MASTSARIFFLVTHFGDTDTLVVVVVFADDDKFWREFADKCDATPTNITKAHVAFVGELSPKLVIVSENDNYYQGVGIAEMGDEKKNPRRS